MTTVFPNPKNRELIFKNLPKSIPPKEARASLYRLFDAALDAFDENGEAQEVENKGGEG